MQTMISGIGRHNVGRIAERIVSNELEYHGFWVSDLNKEGTSVNADLLAARDGRTWQIQVRGASLKPNEKDWWFNYGRVPHPCGLIAWVGCRTLPGASSTRSFIVGGWEYRTSASA